jgi:hypothetical protein
VSKRLNEAFRGVCERLLDCVPTNFSKRYVTRLDYVVAKREVEDKYHLCEGDPEWLTFEVIILAQINIDKYTIEEIYVLNAALSLSKILRAFILHVSTIYVQGSCLHYQLIILSSVHSSRTFRNGLNTQSMPIYTKIAATMEPPLQKCTGCLLSWRKPRRIQS